VRFAWVGFHAEGIPALEALLAAGAPIVAVFTLDPALARERSTSPAYAEVCERFSVPLIVITGLNEPRTLAILESLNVDVVFVMGWPQTIRPAALRIPRLGMIGAHPGLLPRYRGGAPVHWAMIRGEKEAGNTLLWLADRPLAGDIIDQTAFPITPYDTSAAVFSEVARSNRDMLLRLLPRLLAGERPGVPQPPTEEPPLLPRRRAADGRVRWSRPSRAIYDFIRALTHPYPGAFSRIDGRCWRIWKAALPPADLTASGHPPGEVVGPVVSPVSEACGELVACGDGGLILLEVEAEDGTLLRGPALSEQPWTGKRWHDD
jgi:methionyl-tRNA formyltransferase